MDQIERKYIILPNIYHDVDPVMIAMSKFLRECLTMMDIYKQKVESVTIDRTADIFSIKKHYKYVNGDYKDHLILSIPKDLDFVNVNDPQMYKCTYVFQLSAMTFSLGMHVAETKMVLSEDEIKFVILHELSHYKNDDLNISLMAMLSIPYILLRKPLVFLFILFLTVHYDMLSALVVIQIYCHLVSLYSQHRELLADERACKNQKMVEAGISHFSQMDDKKNTVVHRRFLCDFIYWFHYMAVGFSHPSHQHRIDNFRYKKMFLAE